MEKFGKFMTIILAAILSPIINGFVLLKLWTWFIIPIFHLEPLTLVQSIGLVFICNFILYQRNPKEDKDEFWNTILELIITTLSAAITALLCGWIVSLFM
jgi:hypothetical protein